MIADKCDDGIVGQFQAVECVEDAAQLGVHKTDAGEIGAFHVPQFFFVEAIVERLNPQGHGRNLFEMFGGFLGEFDFFQGIEIKIFLGSDAWHMRTIESAGDEKWFVFIFLEETNCFGGDLAIGLFFAGAFGVVEPCERAADVFGLWCVIVDFVFHYLVVPAGVDDVVPGLRVVHAAGADLARDAVMINFADSCGKVTVLFEEFGEGDNIGRFFSETDAVAVDLGGVWTAACHERRAAGVAEGILTIGAVKAYGLFGEAIDMGSFGLGIAIASEGAIQIVGDDEEDVHFARGVGGARCYAWENKGDTKEGFDQDFHNR